MRGRQMASEHLTFPAAIQADHVIGVNGSSDGNCRDSWTLGFGCRFAEFTERLMNGRNQRRQLVRLDLVRPHVRADDLRGECSIDRRGRRLIGHWSIPPLSEA